MRTSLVSVRTVLCTSPKLGTFFCRAVPTVAATGRRLEHCRCDGRRWWWPSQLAARRRPPDAPQQLAGLQPGPQPGHPHGPSDHQQQQPAAGPEAGPRHLGANNAASLQRGEQAGGGQWTGGRGGHHEGTRGGVPLCGADQQPGAGPAGPLASCHTLQCCQASKWSSLPSVCVSIISNCDLVCVCRDDTSSELVSLYTSVWPTGLATNQSIQVFLVNFCINL